MNLKTSRKPNENPEIFKARRTKVAKSILGKDGDSTALIVASHPELIRNNDVNYLFRQDSNMYYLTGFEEPESILLLRPGKNPESVMFVRNKDIERETWDGFRYGPEGAQKEFGFDQVYSIDEFAKKSVELLSGYENLYYRMFKNKEADRQVEKLLLDLKQAFGRSGYGLMSIRDADTFLGEFRLIKDQTDLVNLRKACEISAEAHVVAMKGTKPGMTERQVQALMVEEFYRQGSPREGYSFIVASGNSATTLHYNFNDQVCEDGELLLIDAGAEYNYYTGDITRCYPVNGKFSPAQKAVYNGVLKVQKEVIKAIKPGVFFKDLHELAMNLLVDLMFELNLVKGRKEDVIKSLEYKKYYAHGVGHWLGMDVHDTGLYFIKGKPRPIEAGMTFTVEPGLYIPGTDTVASPELRGIGVRIEDNILVTDRGCEILTSGVPKEISEIEAIVGKNAK